MYLFESLLILSVLEGVDEGVDGGGHPGEDRGDDVEGGHVNIVVDHVDEHEGEEADKEGDKDGEHHLGEAQVLLPLRRGHAVLLGGGLGSGAVLLHVQPGKYLVRNVSLSSDQLSLTCSVSRGRRWRSSRG